MTVWIVTPYGNLPGEGWRDYRGTLIARALLEAGHEVVWWTANFEHRTKAYRSPGWLDMDIEPGFKVRLVPVTPYQQHVSLARVRFERAFGRAFSRRALEGPGPDALIAYPSLFCPGDLAGVAEAFKAPLVVDILDLWPEAFHMALPPWAAPLGRLLFAPLYASRLRFLRRASAVVTCTRDYLEVARKAPWALKEVVYLGVDLARVASVMEDPPPILPGLPPKEQGEVWAIHAGTLGAHYDLDTLLDAAALLRDRVPALRILLAGEGPAGPGLQKRILGEGLSRVHFMGSLQVDAVTRLYGACDLALATYGRGSTVSMPVKAFDYLAAGLPIIHALSRELRDLVRDEGIGLAYEGGDAASLAGALEALALDPSRRKAMAARVRGVATRFDSARQHGRFPVLLERLAGGRP